MLKIEVKERNKTAVVGLAGELSISSIEEFENAFQKYIKSDMSVVALDLGKMPYLDSFGISRIIKMSRAFAGSSTEFVLINMNENIHQIFRMSTFDRIFNIMSGEDFNNKYIPPEKKFEHHDIKRNDEKIKPESSKNDVKIKQIEIDDDNGTTLIFVDDE